MNLPHWWPEGIDARQQDKAGEQVAVTQGGARIVSIRLLPGHKLVAEKAPHKFPTAQRGTC